MNPVTTIDMLVCLVSLAAIVLVLRGRKAGFRRDTKLVLLGLLGTTFLFGLCLAVAWSEESRVLVRGEHILEAMMPMWWGLLFYALVQDIISTERKEVEQALRESERRLSTLLSNLPGMAYRCRNRPSWPMEFISEGCKRLTGYTAQELTGELPVAYGDLIHASDRKLVWDEIQEELARGEPFQLMYRIRAASGEKKWVWEQGRGVHSEDGTLQALEGFITDVTEQKEAVEEVRRLNQELERRVHQRTAQLEAANRDLGEFAYVVSHDLKAPLRAVGQLAHWIAEDHGEAIGEEGRDKVELMIGRVKRMYALIDGVLAYSRLGRMRERQETIDLNLLLREVIETLAPPADLEITVQQDFPTVTAERTRLHQVFQNLLGNAVKFMDKSPGKVTIGWDDAGDFWRFWVADNGPGIEAKYHDKIFGIFQTLAPRDRHESTGVGLALVKRIVEIYGGRIAVESSPGEGTTFFFTFPKKPEKADRENE